MTALERAAAAAREVEFCMPGAGGLRGLLHLGEAQAKLIARAVLKANRDWPDPVLVREIADSMEMRPSEVVMIWHRLVDGILAEGK